MSNPSPLWLAAGGRPEFFATFPPEPTSPSRTREFIAQVMRRAGYCDEELVGRLTLATTELVNNVVEHARTDFEVRVTPEGQAIYAEVVDQARARPCPAHASVDDVHGRGLLLVDALVDDWGVTALSDGPGKRVWIRVLAP